MNDTLVNEVFSTVVGEPPLAQFDVERVIRLGRRRRRARLAGSAATSLVLVGLVAVLVPALYRGVEPQNPSAFASAETPSAPTGFPYSGPAQVHALPNSNYTAPPDLAAVRLAEPAPGFPYRLQPDGLYAMTAATGPACYGAQFAVSTAPSGMEGSSATLLVTDCAAPAMTEGVVEGHPVVGHGMVAGVDGVFTEYDAGTTGSSDRNLVLYFTTGRFTARIEGTGLTQGQLVALGNALTGLH
jgi:hypothetical protein